MVPQIPWALLLAVAPVTIFPSQPTRERLRPPAGAQQNPIWMGLGWAGRGRVYPSGSRLLGLCSIVLDPQLPCGEMARCQWWVRVVARPEQGPCPAAWALRKGSAVTLEPSCSSVRGALLTLVTLRPKSTASPRDEESGSEPAETLTSPLSIELPFKQSLLTFWYKPKAPELDLPVPQR